MSGDATIDARGLACPLPVLLVRKAMRAIGPGTRVEVLATDAGAEEDLRAYCEMTGLRFLSAEARGNGELRILILKC